MVHTVLSFMKVMKVFGKGPESLNHLLSQQGGKVSIMDMVFPKPPCWPITYGRQPFSDQTSAQRRYISLAFFPSISDIAE